MSVLKPKFRPSWIILIVLMLALSVVVGYKLVHRSRAQAPGGNVPVPVYGAYFGIHDGDQANPPDLSPSMTQREQFITSSEQTIGRKFDFDRQFYDWGDDPFPCTGAPSPNAYLCWSSTTGGHVMHVNLVAALRGGGHVTWAQIANGSQDGYLNTLATDIKAWGKPAFFTFQHEPEPKICPNDTDVGCDFTTYYGSTADYKAAWTRIVTTFRGDGVTNLSYVWATTAFHWTIQDYQYSANTYPGDSVIDWMAVDPFNFVVPFNTDGSCPAPSSYNYTKWKDMSTLISPWYTWASNGSLHQIKPLMIGASGSIEDPNNLGRRAGWLNNVQADLKSQYSLVKAMMYYNPMPSDNCSDTRLFADTLTLDTTDPLGGQPNSQTVQAVKSLTSAPYFNTRSCTLAGCPAAGLADLNKDGQVGVVDLSMFATHYGQSGSGLAGDINADGAVNSTDFSMLAAGWGMLGL